MITLLNKIRMSFLTFLNYFFSRRSKTLLFIPHENCKIDHYDVFNYSSDNVLVIARRIFEDSRFDDYDLYIVYYDESKLDDYINFSKSRNRNGKVYWINRSDKIFFIKSLFTCAICLTDHPHYNFSFKKNKQVFISLGYFTPFKDDYYVVKDWSKKKRRAVRDIMNNSFDWHITTSSLAGRILATDTLLEYEKFLPLGFPRNDFFYSKKNKLKILEEFGIVDTQVVVCYTPTFRDYERPDLEQYNKDMSKKKTLLGYLNKKESNELAEVLEKYKAVIIAKLHPWQEKNVINDISQKRVISYNSICNDKYSLYDILSVSDILITDYTSTSFDFLHANKPIIYYFYDYEKYSKTRGFSFDPIQGVCSGPIAKNASELIDVIEKCFSQRDEFEEKRCFVNDIINKYHDADSSMRIIDFIYNLSQ